MADEATTGLASSLIGTVLSGRYRLESKLGSGGMSTVYLARDSTLERWVAVKVMHREMSDQPDQIERFRREARAVAQLSIQTSSPSSTPVRTAATPTSSSSTSTARP